MINIELPKHIAELAKVNTFISHHSEKDKKTLNET